MQIFIHIYAYIYIQIYIYTHIYIYIHIYIQISLRIYIRSSTTHHSQASQRHRISTSRQNSQKSALQSFHSANLVAIWLSGNRTCPTRADLRQVIYCPKILKSQPYDYVIATILQSQRVRRRMRMRMRGSNNSNNSPNSAQRFSKLMVAIKQL